MHTTPADVHPVNTYLENVGIQYMNDQTKMVSVTGLPIVPVKNETGRYLIFEKSHWFRREAGTINPGEAIPTSDYGRTYETYAVQEYGLGHQIAERIANNADSIMRLQMNGTKFVSNHVLLEREIRTAAVIHGTWTNTSAPALTWDDADSVPVEDIYDYIDTVEDNAPGRYPNIGVCDITGMRALREHPDIIKVLHGAGGAGPAKVKAEALADFFDFEKWLVGRGTYTASPEGTAEASVAYTKIWSKSMFVGYVNFGSPSIDIPSAYYMFRKGYMARTYHEQRTRSDYIEASELAVVQKIAEDCGFIGTTVVA